MNTGLPLVPGSPNSQGAISRVFKEVLLDPILVYALFILSVPQGVLDLFSPYHFKPPGNIPYPLYNSPVSLLFLPVLLFAAYHLVLARRVAFQVKGLLIFWALFLLWQPFNILYLPHPEPTDITWELFFSYGLALIFLYAVAARRPTADGLAGVGIVWAALQSAGAILGTLTGQSANFEGRLNAPNLDIGATALLLGGISFLLAVRPGREKYLSLIPVPLLLMTGSRAPLVLTLLLLPFALAAGGDKTPRADRPRGAQFPRKALVATVVFGILLVSIKVLAGSVGDIPGRMDFVADPTQLQSDASMLGRLSSVMAGLQVLSSNPFGIPFSTVELQLMMGRYGYPTFPHNNFLVWLIMFGPFAVVPLFLLVKYALKVFKARSPHRFCYLYFILYSLIAGGIDPYFKQVFIYLLFFLVCVRSTVPTDLALEPYHQVGV